MAKSNINLKELEALAKRLESSADRELASAVEAFLLEMAFRFEAKVKNRTPVGEIDGGTLRANWKVGGVAKKGDHYLIEVINPTEYAMFVEYGHRQTPGRFVPAIGKRLKKGWVEGRFMATISAKELEREMPGHLKGFRDKLVARLKQ